MHVGGQIDEQLLDWFPLQAAIRQGVMVGEAQRQARDDKLRELEAAKASLDAFVLKTGNEQYAAMSQMTGGRVSQEALSGWLLVFVAGGFLLVLSRLSDWLLEELEK